MKKNKFLLGTFVGFFAFFGLVIAANNFTDISGHWAEGYLNWGIDNGLLMGDDAQEGEEKTIRPDDSVTRAEMMAILKRYDDMKNKKELLVGEGAELPPADLQERGYLYAGESKTTEDGKYTYQTFTKENDWCSAGYINENVPIHCALRVTQANGQVVLDIESDERAEFTLNGVTFVAPRDWYNNESLLIQDGFGDGGVATGNGKTYNVATEKLNLLYDYQSWSGQGSFITVGENKIFFHETEEGFDVYEVNDDSIKNLYDFCPEQSADCLTPSTDILALTSETTKINELIKADWAIYELEKGIIVSALGDDGGHLSYLYDIEKNEFIPRSE